MSKGVLIEVHAEENGQASPGRWHIVLRRPDQREVLAEHLAAPPTNTFRKRTNKAELRQSNPAENPRCGPYLPKRTMSITYSSPPAAP